ncbi:MAG TPA: glycosyltransferase family 4 protein [Tahibacter sp.]|nr:glycosyltransferase family 4 protein [Tahibacter sp.]
MDAWIVPLAFVVSAVATEAAIRYANRRQMLDQPGRRRLHALPTPRGGGIGIVVAALLVIAFGLPLHALVVPWSVALALVAGVGWWDDHRPLAAAWRLAVHLVAAVVLLWPNVPALLTFGAMVQPAMQAQALIWLVFAVAVLSTVWSVNLHNFVDGINGLLAAQATWTFAALGCIGHAYLAPRLGWVPYGLAAATLAFVPFNFPRARVFMGDVGSGALGLLVAATIWLPALSTLEPRWLTLGLIVVSAAAVDTTATLLSRMFAGRRWYSAHREHLYQWLVRSGRSHARVVGYTMAWNLLIAAPAAVVATRTPRFGVALGVTFAVYAAGFVAWIFARRAVLAGVRARD